MNSAILSGRHLICLDLERRFRGITRIEELTVGLSVSNDFYPFDVVLFLHGVSDIPHFDLKALCGLLDHWHMFFFGRINCVLHEKLHVLPTADQLTSATMQYFDDVATEITLINLQSFSHSYTSF